MARFDALHRAPHELLDADDFPRAALGRDLEDALLGTVQQGVHVLRSLVGGLDDLGARLDQAPPQRLVAHDAAVVLDVRGRGHDVEQVGDVVGAARGLEVAGPHQLFAQHHRVHDVAPLDDLRHRAEDPAVRIAVESGVVQQLDCLQCGVGVEQHGSEDGLFGLLAPRSLPAAAGFSRGWRRAGVRYGRHPT